MKKILLWGMGTDYNSLLNQILFEIQKGNITVKGIVCRNEDIYCDYKDGFKVVVKDKISSIDYDYIIITGLNHYSQIVHEALQLGIPREKIIHGKLLHYPYFDFKKYCSLRENPVTILSDDCWGGYVYDRLDLPFSSPLINIYWDGEEYARFIENPIFYLNTDLKIEREGNLKKGIFPIASLGDGINKVELQLVHNSCFEEALEQWNRRIKRINFNNMFVKMGFSSNIDALKKEKCISSFNATSYKKILFYYGDEKINDAFKTERFFVEELKNKRVEMFNYNDYLRLNYFGIWIYSIFCYTEKTIQE